MPKRGTASHITSIWTPYGLRGDPYFVQALDPTIDPDDTRPATLHVGRSDELRRVATVIQSSGNSRTVLQGEAGVGKTSFVSALKTQLQSESLLTHADPIRVQPNMNSAQFIAEVLKVLIQMRSTERLRAGVVANARSRVEAGWNDPEGKFWTRVTRIIAGDDNVSVGVTAGVVGLQGQRGRITAEATDLSLFDELKTALSYLARGKTRSVLLHVNNMEGLSPNDAAAAAALIHSLRDAFLFDNAHWLFVGTSDIEERLFRVQPQVSQIVGPAITLASLSTDETAELLARRYGHLQSGLRFTDPISPEAAARLYARFKGELRGFLGLLGTAVREWSSLHPGQTMEVEDVIAIARPTQLAELRRKIGENDAERLVEIMASQTYDAEFRVADVRARCGMTQAGASKLVQRLLAVKVIAPTRSEGRSRFYGLASGPASIAIGVPDALP